MRGHVFIAQPPLYKVKRGSSEQYLKDERAREDYLIGHGLDGAVLRLASGEERAGADLRALVEEARVVRHLLTGLHSRYDRGIVEQAAIAGALRRSTTRRTPSRRRTLPHDARRPPRRARRRHGARLARPHRTRRLRHDPRAARRHAGGDPRRRAARLGGSAAPQRAPASLGRDLCRPARLVRKGDDRQVSGPGELLDAVMAAGGKGISQMQRYKGLGEMNADQLWETTLDRDARSLLQVKINEGRRGRRHLRQADGRRRRAAARVHPGERAQRRQSRRVSALCRGRRLRGDARHLT